MRLANALHGGSSPFRSLLFTPNFVESMEEILSPIEDDEATQDALQEHLSVHLRAQFDELEDGRARVWVRMPTNMPTDVAVGLKIELLGDDEVLATAELCTTPEYHWFQSEEARRGKT